MAIIAFISCSKCVKLSYGTLIADKLMSDEARSWNAHGSNLPVEPYTLNPQPMLLKFIKRVTSYVFYVYEQITSLRFVSMVFR